MTIYAIGDIQGCFDEFQALLSKIQFNKKRDILWLTGDLVNRGSHSLETLRFVKSLGDSALSVLGNHDLHLLALVLGSSGAKSFDTLDEILSAHDAEELCQWLRYRPLLHYDEPTGYALAHAGLYPAWDIVKAVNYARELETVLQGNHCIDFLNNMYGDTPHVWDDSLMGIERLRFITNAFTRMRLCGPDGSLDLKYKGPPSGAPEHYIPWFKVQNRANRAVKIIFGHWASLECKVDEPNVYALDSGCVWGNCLTAMRIPDGAYFRVDCKR